MPTTPYNPDEFARAKHFVALAEQINTKINTVSARTSRPVSLACRDGNDFKQLDSAASSLSIPFKNLTAVLRITSGAEDVVPTITLSNSVTASTPTYSNGVFETTLTLPSASVTSFSMTITLPQTETFSAWSKTLTVSIDTEAKTARNVKVAYVDYSQSTSGTQVTIADGTATIPLAALQNASGSRRLVVNVSNTPPLLDDVSRLVLSDLSTTVGTVSVTSISNFLASNNCQLAGTLSNAVAQVITFRLSLAENATYVGWSQLFTITITE